jgi:hypothetical protein
VPINGFTHLSGVCAGAIIVERKSSVATVAGFIKFCIEVKMFIGVVLLFG